MAPTKGRGEFSFCQLNWDPAISASVEINHILARGQDGKISHRCSCKRIMVESVTKPFISRTDKRIAESLYMKLSVPAQPGQAQPHSSSPPVSLLSAYSTLPPECWLIEMNPSL